MTLPTQASVRIIKTIDYRGTTKRWSNRYFFGDLTTLDSTKFNDLVDDIVAHEKPCTSEAVSWVEAIGYNGGSAVSAFEKSLSGAGSMSHSGVIQAPRDCAAMIRFPTSQRTTKNHLIYLFKWYHDAWILGSSGPDVLWATQKTALAGLGAFLVTGPSSGGTHHPISSPRGAVAQSSSVSNWIRHRDFRKAVTG